MYEPCNMQTFLFWLGHNYFKETSVGGDTVQLIIWLIRFAVAPKFIASPPQQVEIDVYGNGSLTCDVSADPSPSFKWYKDGKQLTTST